MLRKKLYTGKRYRLLYFEIEKLTSINSHNIDKTTTQVMIQIYSKLDKNKKHQYFVVYKSVWIAREARKCIPDE